MVVAMTVGVVAVYLLRLDEAAGLYKDDAYYMVLAKGLASGDGYALTSSAASPILPAFPPGFPLLLAPVFAIAPNYPDNVLWLKLISVAAMIGAGALTYRYFAGYRQLDRGKAATIALLTALTPSFVFLATSTVMSECVFTLAMMASVVALERAARAEDLTRARRDTAVAAVATTAAWLVRAPGAAFVAGGALFLLWKRGWRTSLGFIAVCAIAYAPWAAYGAAHRSTNAERVAHGGSVAYTYVELMLTRYGGDLRTGTVTIGELPARVAANFVNVFGHDMGAIVFPAGYRDASESGLEVFMLTGQTGFNAGSMGLGTGVVILSAIATVLVLIGFRTFSRPVGAAEFFCAVMIALILLIPPARTYRYVLPLAPFLLAYFLAGVESLASWLRAGSGAPVVRIVAACLVFFLALEHGQYIWQKVNGPPPPWIADGREVRTVTDFINRHVPAEGSAVSTNPALLYLLTGHKAVVYVDSTDLWKEWRARGIQYAVALNQAPRPNRRMGYRVLHESSRLKLWVLELDTGEP